MMIQMRTHIARVAFALVCSASVTVLADTKTVASSLDVFVFPAENQTPERQAQDEAACYQWAAGHTGTDPQAIGQQQQADQQQAQVQQQAAQQTGQGSGARGAVRGAAAGALIGEIANDDAGEGAAWGAAAGAVRGRRQGRQAQAQAQAQVAAAAQQQQALTSEQLTNFKKAFSACLEGKKYSVKF